MRFLFVFFNFVIFTGIFSFHQTDYHVIFERLDVAFYNKSYIDKVDLKVYFWTRYSKRCNISFDLIQDLDAHLMTFHLEGKKYQSNEYRLFPFNNSENVCKGLHSTNYGLSFNKFETNFKLNCSIKARNYYIRNINYNDSEFPPYAPRGRYLLIASLLYKKNILLAKGNFYIEIKAQNPLERTIGG